MLKRQRIVVIDGYNVLRNSERYAHFVGAAPNFEDWTSEVWNAAREALLNDVLKTLDKNSQAIIVYDAAKREAPSAEFAQGHSFALSFDTKNGVQNITKNCQIIFTNPGESADARIQKLVYASRQKGLEVQVVTSDLGIQDATMNKGVVRTSSREFVNNVAENVNAEAGTSASKPIQTKIEDAVDAETAAKLRHLRDNL